MDFRERELIERLRHPRYLGNLHGRPHLDVVDAVAAMAEAAAMIEQMAQRIEVAEAHHAV